MKHTDWCSNWEFQYGEPSGFPMMQAKTKTVSLPHDAMISGDVTADAPGGAECGFYKGTKVSYTKRFEVSAQELESTRYILSFDGCAGAMKLVVNGNLVMHHHYAYSPFQADITPYLTSTSSNRVTVTVNNTDEPNRRWYSGTGLYRKVELLTAPALHIAPNGVYVRLDHMEGDQAVLRSEITLVNDGAQDAEVVLSGQYRLHEPFLTKRAAAAQDAFDDNRRNWKDADFGEKEIIPAGSTLTVQRDFSIDHALLWDIDDPQLYDLCVHVCGDGEKSERASAAGHAGEDDRENSPAKDRETVVFGIRMITMDAEHGFVLNGRSTNLKGGCIHHDNGILGAAAYRDAEYRKVSLLKENGFNAIRFAHNPMSSDLLNACDELGMLVIDEAFDVWNMEKNDLDFSQYFAKEGEQELRNMVLRDRNHPSIFLWSIGNEIPEQGGLSGGYETSRNLAALVRSLDSSRAVGGALCSFFRGLSDEDNAKYWADIMAHADELKKNGMVNLDCDYGKSIFDPYTAPFVQDWDAVGYNYLSYQYEPTHEKHPDRVMICTESKPRELAAYWNDVERLPYLIGDFEWTAIDYLGEAGIGTSYYVDEKDVQQTAMMMHRAQFPSRTAGSGDFDICGFEKPQLLYRRIVWGSKETAVVTHDPSHNGKIALLGRYDWGDVQHGYSWNVKSPESNELAHVSRTEESSELESVPGSDPAAIRAEVYSGAPEVELFLNGTSLGKKPAGKDQEYKAAFEFPYEAGTLTAVSYDADGNEISRDKVQSAGEPAGLKLSVQNNNNPAAAGFRADGQSLIYVTAEIVDQEGNRVPWAEDQLSAEVTGAATLVAFGSGRSATTENYTSGHFTTFQGRALAVLRCGTSGGKAMLSVRGDRFSAESITLQIR